MKPITTILLMSLYLTILHFITSISIDFLVVVLRIALPSVIVGFVYSLSHQHIMTQGLRLTVSTLSFIFNYIIIKLVFGIALMQPFPLISWFIDYENQELFAFYSDRLLAMHLPTIIKLLMALSLIIVFIAISSFSLKLGGIMYMGTDEADR